jgi:hypothetical protein
VFQVPVRIPKHGCPIWASETWLIARQGGHQCCRTHARAMCRGGHDDRATTRRRTRRMASRSQIIRGVAPQVPGNAFPGAWIAIWILSSRQCCHVNGKGARLQIKSENQMNRGPQGGMTGADSETKHPHADESRVLWC